jgi:hypothetical protein
LFSVRVFPPYCADNSSLPVIMLHGHTWRCMHFTANLTEITKA